MRKTNSFITWRMALISLLVWWCAAQIKPADAQTKQQTAERIPGIPAGYTIIEGDIQMPTGVANAMRLQARQETPIAKLAASDVPH